MKYLIAAILSFLVMYILFSFIYMEINPSVWGKGTRIFYVLLSTMVGMIATLCISDIPKDLEDTL